MKSINFKYQPKNATCVIWESNPGLPDVARMATENFTTKPITLHMLEPPNILTYRLLASTKKNKYIAYRSVPTSTARHLCEYLSCPHSKYAQPSLSLLCLYRLLQHLQIPLLLVVMGISEKEQLVQGVALPSSA
jgi:hypothetical protein